MNSVSPFSNPLAGKLVLSGLICISSISAMKAAPPPEKAGKPGKAKSERRKNAEGVASQE